jgi:hypothetical protein
LWVEGWNEGSVFAVLTFLERAHIYDSQSIRKFIGIEFSEEKYMTGRLPVF